MKKVLIVILCAMLLFSFAACNSTGFMSASKVKKVVKELGTSTPQAEMTLKFKSNGKEMTYVITYDLLLDKAPIAVINFINLVNDGFYDNAILDSYVSQYNCYIGARYAYRADGEGKLEGKQNTNENTFIGEFKSNNYPEPEGGYAQFSMFSLAMYHGELATDFDSANGAFILTTSETGTRNANNYAVFAKMNSISIYRDDETEPLATYKDGNMSSTYLKQMKDLNGRTYSIDMHAEDGTSNSVTVLGSSKIPTFVFSIKMLGNSDWSILPKVN